MNFPRRAALTLAAGLLLAPLGLAAQSADTPPATEDEAQQSETEAAKPEAEAEEEKRICRYVRLDTSSRRKTKVCRTVEEWRELNNPR